MTPLLRNVDTPRNLEAEAAVLGICLTDPTAFPEAAALLCAEDFWSEWHALLWNIFEALHARGVCVEMLAVGDQINRMKRGQPGDVAVSLGDTDLLGLMERAPVSSLLSHHCRQVREATTRRRIIGQAEQAIRLAECGELSAFVGRRAEFDLGALALPQQEAHARSVCLADIPTERIGWLWKGWLPRGKLVIMSGDPGLFKSGITMDLAARLTTGRPMPLYETSFLPPQNVLFFSAEDGLADTLRPRLEAMGADLSRVRAYTPREMPEFDIEAVRAEVEAFRPALIVLDPMQAFVPSAAEGKAMSALRRRFLNPLIEMAETYGCTVIGLAHLNKMDAVSNALYRSSGRIDYVAAARSAVVFGKDPETPGAFLMASAKINLCAPPQTLRYHVESRNDDDPPLVVWDGPVEGRTADGLMSGGQRNRSGEEAPQRDAAGEFIREALSAGPMFTAEFNDLGRSAGFALRTLERARIAVGVRTRRAPGDPQQRWQVYLPEAIPPTPPQDETE